MMSSLGIAGMVKLSELQAGALQDDSTTVVPIQTSFDEDSVSKITFVVTFQDSAADGPAGDQLRYMLSHLHSNLPGQHRKSSSMCRARCAKTD